MRSSNEGNMFEQLDVDVDMKSSNKGQYANNKAQESSEDMQVNQLFGQLVYEDSKKVPINKRPQAHKISSHGIDDDFEERGDSVPHNVSSSAKPSTTTSQTSNRDNNTDEGVTAQTSNASKKLLELAGSNHLTKVRNAFQGKSPPRSPTDDLTSNPRMGSTPSSMDSTLDQLLANTVTGSLLNQTPTPRRQQMTPSPTTTTDYNPNFAPSNTPGDASSQDEDYTPVDALSDTDRRLEEANKEISKLTRQTFQMSAEKELVEGDLDFWKTRALQLEQRLRNAEEDAVQKDQQVEELERQLDMARTPITATRSPSTHPGSRMSGSPASDDHRSNSINSHHSAEHQRLLYSSPLTASAPAYAATQSTPYRYSVFAQAQHFHEQPIQQQIPAVSTEARVQPALLQLMQAIRQLALKLIFRAQENTDKFQEDLRHVITQLMKNENVRQAWKFISEHIIPAAGWAGLSAFIVIVCTGFLQMWKQGARTLLTWMS
eukprot:TRINITY_DN5380_c1_g1_i2.p1 TRINITY_DN5380_c1_g1~~TRINITY_DN5380_c1_g1_i2.p1  ORF type:complete len:488 (+),score=69.44 TRINITY_DN5380_c1_g1_i2:496-1959(+)